jgi:hypothetical protein
MNDLMVRSKGLKSKMCVKCEALKDIYIAQKYLPTLSSLINLMRILTKGILIFPPNLLEIKLNNNLDNNRNFTFCIMEELEWNLDA